MSETQSNAETANQGAPQPKSNTRTMVLLGILAIAVAALVYDYQIARPAVEAAHQKVNEVADERSQSAEGQLTNKEVAELFAKSPSEEKKGPHYLLERYSWMSGLPWRSYDCWIVYTPANNGDEVTYRFNSAYLNEEPEDQFQPDFVPENPDVDTELPGDPVGASTPPGGGGGGSTPDPDAPGEEPSEDQPPGGDEPPGPGEPEAPSGEPMDDEPMEPKPEGEEPKKGEEDK